MVWRCLEQAASAAAHRAPLLTLGRRAAEQPARRSHSPRTRTCVGRGAGDHVTGQGLECVRQRKRRCLSPASPIVVVAPFLAPSSIVRALVVQHVNAGTHALPSEGAPGGHRRLVRGEAHDGHHLHGAAELAARDIPKWLEHLADGCFISSVCEVKQGKCAVELRGARRDLLQLQDCGANCRRKLPDNTKIAASARAVWVPVLSSEDKRTYQICHHSESTLESSELCGGSWTLV